MEKSLIIISLIILGSFTKLSAQDKGLFWYVITPDLQDTSYLYGTMHVKDSRVFQYDPLVETALTQSEVYAMEINMNDVNQEDLMTMMLMKKEQKLSNLLDTNDYKEVEKFFSDSLHQPLILFDRMLPILTAQLVNELDFSDDNALPLDLHFNKLAVEHDLEIIGLETFEEQINAISVLGYDSQAEMLLETVRLRYDAVESEREKMNHFVDLYVAGELDSLLSADNEVGLDPKEEEAFNTEMLVNRNKRMTKRITKLVENEQAFIAIGAAHLGGKDGVISLLRKKKFLVIPVNS